MTQRSRSFVFVCGLACLFGFLPGCTVVYNEPSKPVTLEPAGKIDLAVELRLTGELQQAKWEERVVWDHYIQPLGNALSIIERCERNRKVAAL